MIFSSALLLVPLTASVRINQKVKVKLDPDVWCRKGNKITVQVKVPGGLFSRSTVKGIVGEVILTLVGGQDKKCTIWPDGGHKSEQVDIESTAVINEKVCDRVAKLVTGVTLVDTVNDSECALESKGFRFSVSPIFKEVSGEDGVLDEGKTRESVKAAIIKAATEVCQAMAELGTAEFKSIVTVNQAGSFCVFDSSGFKFKLAPVMQEGTLYTDKVKDLFSWSRHCSESEECRALGDELRLVSTSSQVQYRGVIFSLYGDEMKSLTKIDEKAKRVLCESVEPLKFTDASKDVNYLISNQKGDGCELRLYLQKTESSALIRTVKYEKLVYRDNFPSEISFANTWDAAVKPNHADETVDFDWCHMGLSIELNWKGATRTAIVVETTVTSRTSFAKLGDLKCKVKLTGGDSEQVSISIIHPVTRQTTIETHDEDEGAYRIQY